MNLDATDTETSEVAFKGSALHEPVKLSILLGRIRWQDGAGDGEA